MGRVSGAWRNKQETRVPPDSYKVLLATTNFLPLTAAVVREYNSLSVTMRKNARKRRALPMDGRQDTELESETGWLSTR
jgi:hypothetical protein